MKKDKTIFVVGLLFSCLIIGSSSFLYFKNTQLKSNLQNLNALVTPVPKEIKPQESINYKSSKIEVLNATKKSGLAKVYADKLIGLGYTNVITGNYEGDTDTNLLFAPTDFKEDLIKIDFKNYEYKKNNSIQIIIGSN